MTKPGYGKSKGASFERAVCRELSLWMSEGEHEDLYWRSAMSGGRSTVAAAKGKRLAAQAGDISCVNELGHALTDKFLIECKSWKDLNFVSLIKPGGNLVKFWLETKAFADQYQKHPMLIAKQNQQPTCVCLNKVVRKLLLGPFHLYVPELDLYIIRFKDFIEKAVRPT